jgi:hypothetical protein
MIKRTLFLVAVLASALSGQTISSLPRTTSTTGLNDSALVATSDSARATRAASLAQYRKALSVKAFDSLITSKLNLTGATVTGAPTWSSKQTLATSGLADTATGAARAQVLTTARTIGGTSFNGSANIVPGFADSATGAARAQILTTARTIGGTSFNGSANIVPAFSDSSTGSARAQKLTTARTLWGVSFDGTANVTGDPTFTNITVTSCTGCGGADPLRLGNGSAAAPSFSFTNSTGAGLYRFGADTIGFATNGAHSLDVSGGATVKLRGGAGNMIIQAGTGTSRTLALQVTDASSVARTCLSVSDAQVYLANSGCVGTIAPKDTIRFEGTSTKVLGGAGNMTITAGTGNARSLTLQSSNSTGVATTFASGAGDTLKITAHAIATGLTAAAGTPHSICRNSATGEITNNAATSCVVSSRRYKQDIKPLAVDDAVGMLSRLRPSTFQYKEGGRRAIGLIAEEVDSVDARLVTRDEKGRVNSVNYEQITILLLSTVQRQQRQIDSLRVLVQGLKK